MKKNKFSNKLELNKKIVSNFKVTTIIGGGPTFFVSCPPLQICDSAPKHSDQCLPSEGCVPFTEETCPTLYYTC